MPHLWVDPMALFRQMGIPLTQVLIIDTVAPWTMQDRSPASITRARSRRWTIGSGPRTAAWTTYDGCDGLADSCAGGAGVVGSRG